jgi:biopolymer transport protein ExbB/TolQ
MPAIFYQSPPPVKSKPGPSVVVVKPHHRWHCGIMVGLALMIVMGLGIFLCQNSLQILGNQQQVLVKKSILEQESYLQQIKELQLQNKSLSLQNGELRNKLTDVVRTTQRSQSSYVKTLDSLEQALEENREIKEELSYYKKLLKAHPICKPK